MLKVWKKRQYKPDRLALEDWWAQIALWRSRDCLKFSQDLDGSAIIKPPYAIKRLAERMAGRDDVVVTTAVCQDTMWAAQHHPFHKPHQWMASHRATEAQGHGDKCV